MWWWSIHLKHVILTLGEKPQGELKIVSDTDELDTSKKHECLPISESSWSEDTYNIIQFTSIKIFNNYVFTNSNYNFLQLRIHNFMNYKNTN